MASDFNFEALLRPNIRNAKAYSSARDEYSGTEGVFLDANENPYHSVGGGHYNRYPDPYQHALKNKIAALKGVSPDQVFLGNGSDEPIDLLLRAVANPGKDAILICPPTYGMYEVAAGINDVTIVRVPLDADFQLDLPNVLKAINEHANLRLLFLCSPNNPSGNLMEAEAMKTIIQSFSGIVVIDEAYIDFAGTPSFLESLNDYPNVVVLQTFSKAWGMAGLRLGMAFAAPNIIHVLNRIKPPYNINSLTQAYALEALDKPHELRTMLEESLNEREALKIALGHLPGILRVYPSSANFLLIKVKDGHALYTYLVERKIITRDRSSVIGCDGCVRISIGTPDENKELFEGIKSFLTERS
jgi:histidinol-phosphate aminotransferase